MKCEWKSQKKKRERKMKKQTNKKKNSNNRQSTVNLLNSGKKEKKHFSYTLSLDMNKSSDVPNTSERTANTTKRGQIWVKKRYRIRRSTKFPYLEENLWLKPMNFSLFRGPVAPSFLLVSRIILLIPTEHMNIRFYNSKNICCVCISVSIRRRISRFHFIDVILSPCFSESYKLQ